MLVPLTSRQTIDLAASALASGRGAGLPELLELIQSLSSKIDRVSLSELSGLIEQDPAVAARLIGIANMIAHNPGMTTLTTVAHAIHQVGFQRVRSLAISLMLIESTGGRRNPPEQRQAASRALCAGLLAQACARQVHAVDPEMVFACTTLRHLGRIILPVVSIEHYRAAMAEVPAATEAAAFRRYFGLAPLELSRELLRSYTLPPDIQDALDEFHPGAGRVGSASHSQRLMGIAEYGGRLARIVLDLSVDDAGYRQETTALAETFGQAIPNAGELLTPTLLLAGERLAQFMQVPGTSTLPEMLLRRLRSRLPKDDEANAAPARVPGTVPARAVPPPPAVAPAAGRPPPASPAPSPAPAAPTARRREPPPAQSAPAPTPAAPATARADDLPEGITLVPGPARRLSVNEPWLEVLRPIRDGFGAGDCAVFLRSASDGPFVLAEGLGPLTTHHQDTAAVHPGEKTVFGIALTRRETVVIHDSRTATLQSYLPPWFQRDPHTPAAFLLVPLATGDHVNGLVLIGWPKSRRIELTTGHESLLQLLRSSAERLCRDSGRGSLLRLSA